MALCLGLDDTSVILLYLKITTASMVAMLKGMLERR